MQKPALRKERKKKAILQKYLQHLLSYCINKRFCICKKEKNLTFLNHSLNFMKSKLVFKRKKYMYVINIKTGISVYGLERYSDF